MRFSLSSAVGLSMIALLACVGSAASLEEDKIKGIEDKIERIIADQKEGFNAIVWVNVTLCLNLYAISLDRKDYSTLEYVYTQDVIANVVPNTIVGLPTLEKFYAKVLGTHKTKHIISNVLVYNITDTTANAISDTTAAYFPSGKFIGNTTIPLLTFDQTLKIFEQFEDKFTRGNDGIWRISERQMTTLAVVGNETLLNSL